jgi:hypothetical protein
MTLLVQKLEADLSYGKHGNPDYPICSRPSSLMNTDFSTSIVILDFSAL